MQRIIALLMFASFGALLTMLLLPPAPVYRVYTPLQPSMAPYGRQYGGYRVVVDLENEPIAGNPSPQHSTTRKRVAREDHPEIY